MLRFLQDLEKLKRDKMSEKFIQEYQPISNKARGMRKPPKSSTVLVGNHTGNAKGKGTKKCHPILKG